MQGVARVRFSQSLGARTDALFTEAHGRTEIFAPDPQNRILDETIDCKKRLLPNGVAWYKSVKGGLITGPTALGIFFLRDQVIFPILHYALADRFRRGRIV